MIVEELLRELESLENDVVFGTNTMKRETEMVGESGKYYMFGSEMVTHNLEEKYDIDQIKSENVIDVYYEPKSEKYGDEISESPQNKFLDIIQVDEPPSTRNLIQLASHIASRSLRHVTGTDEADLSDGKYPDPNRWWDPDYLDDDPPPWGDNDDDESEEDPLDQPIPVLRPLPLNSPILIEDSPPPSPIQFEIIDEALNCDDDL
ncbi:uncharacterized protein [Leptinotarsa decemlineata]|uniref:uncharacterized protein n=1 Tax=Leptinotarsa decemlineata TaxID=7539 RepID=UPI003D30B0C4